MEHTQNIMKVNDYTMSNSQRALQWRAGENISFRKPWSCQKNDRFNDHFLTNTPDSKTGGFLNHAFINFEEKLICISNKRYIRHQTARVIVVNSVLFFIFAISSQVTKASSEVCSSTTLPNLMESLERNTPHYKLPPTCWGPTPLRKTPLKRWNTLFGRGMRGTLDTTTPGGPEARVLTAPPTSETARWGNHFCFRYQETKLLNFLDMLGGVGGFCC